MLPNEAGYIPDQPTYSGGHGIPLQNNALEQEESKKITPIFNSLSICLHYIILSATC